MARPLSVREREDLYGSLAKWPGGADVANALEATILAREAKITAALNALARWEGQTTYEGKPAEEGLRVAGSVLREIGEALRGER